MASPATFTASARTVRAPRAGCLCLTLPLRHQRDRLESSDENRLLRRGKDAADGGKHTHIRISDIVIIIILVTRFRVIAALTVSFCLL